MQNRILVVDDEHVIADTLAVILRNSGYNVAVCYDAQSALRECDRHTPDLIVSDVVMPGMNGVDMAFLVRERHPACKVLLFSGQASCLDLLEQARRRGYDFDLLHKPVHPKDLLAKIAEREEAPASDPVPEYRKPPIPFRREEPETSNHVKKA